MTTSRAAVRSRALNANSRSSIQSWRSTLCRYSPACSATARSPITAALWTSQLHGQCPSRLILYSGDGSENERQAQGGGIPRARSDAWLRKGSRLLRVRRALAASATYSILARASRADSLCLANRGTRGTNGPERACEPWLNYILKWSIRPLTTITSRAAVQSKALKGNILSLMHCWHSTPWRCSTVCSATARSPITAALWILQLRGQCRLRLIPCSGDGSRSGVPAKGKKSAPMHPEKISF